MRASKSMVAGAMAAATLVVFVATIAAGGALQAGLAPWPGIAVVALAVGSLALSWERGSFPVAAFLAASGVVGVVYALAETDFLATATFPGPIFGLIIGLPLLLAAGAHAVPNALPREAHLTRSRPSRSPSGMPMPQRTVSRPERTHSQGRQARPIDRSQRSGRNASERRTSKPQTTLEQTSKTAILRTCMDTITECFDYCINQGGRHAEPHHLRAHLDAWDLLNATTTLVARNSELADDQRAICARAVKRCEESCEEFGDDDEMMKACADVCREAYEHLAS